MSAVRVHHYSVSAGNLDEFLAKRAGLIAGIRGANPALTETRLIRLEDGSYTDVWHWTSAEVMIQAQQASAGFPLIGAVMSLTADGSALNGEIIDER